MKFFIKLQQNWEKAWKTHTITVLTPHQLLTVSTGPCPALQGRRLGPQADLGHSVLAAEWQQQRGLRPGPLRKELRQSVYARAPTVRGLALPMSPT